MDDLIAWLRNVAPRQVEGKAKGFAFQMDGLCLQELNAKINEAADRIEKLEAFALSLANRDDSIGDDARATLSDNTRL